MKYMYFIRLKSMNEDSFQLTATQKIGTPSYFQD